MKPEINNKSKRLRKFFYLSLLCLFPGFGLIIGAVLLVYAVFIFRNLTLTLTIILTMAGGYCLIKLDTYYLKRDLMFGKETGNHLQLLAREDLDDIVRELDLYEVKYQHYPDNLKQLEKQDPALSIVDPLAARDTSKNRFIYFYYFKQSDKYQLFSAGLDRIPHTKDDIYPSTPVK